MLIFTLRFHMPLPWKKSRSPGYLGRWGFESDSRYRQKGLDLYKKNPAKAADFLTAFCP
jgi:hypothetical protein